MHYKLLLIYKVRLVLLKLKNLKGIPYSNCCEHYKLLKLNPQATFLEELSLKKRLHLKRQILKN